MRVKSNKTRITENKGITLVALVVTIVVLIILATISIYAVLGENGLIAKAQQAKELHEQSKQEEQDKLDNAGEIIGDYLNGYTGGNAGPTMPSTWDKDKVTVIDDGKGNPVPVPKDFHYIGGNIDTGIVISDKQGDTIDAEGVNMGNQFVWIPANAETLTRTMFKNEQPSDTDEYGITLDAYTEPYASGYATEASEYSTMKTQVLKYGGFYIGRFEAGINSDKLREGTTTAQTVVSKKKVAPYNYVPWGKAMNDASEVEGKSGAVYLATNFDTQEGYTSVTSTLCYGCQWDAMCRYIGDSGRTTLTKSGVELTGSVSSDVSKNIYDLSGNCWEWTMEVDDTYLRTRRGGYCYYDGPVSYRIPYSLECDPTYNNDSGGFRCVLYIK